MCASVRLCVNYLECVWIDKPPYPRHRVYIIIEDDVEKTCFKFSIVKSSI